jgi:hypothetical protein
MLVTRNGKYISGIRFCSIINGSMANGVPREDVVYCALAAWRAMLNEQCVSITIETMMACDGTKYLQFLPG